MCDGVIEVERLEGPYWVEVVPRGHVLEDGKVTRRNHR